MGKHKTIIGLVGKPGAGKGSFAHFIKGFSERAAIIKFSGIIRQTLDLWGLSATRENIQNLTTPMIQCYGPEVLNNAIRKQIDESPAEIILVDGVRRVSEMDLIRSYPKNLLVYIDADPQIRFERTKVRGENYQEDETTFEQFMKHEEHQLEAIIPELGAQADVTIINNGSEADFKKEAEEFFNTHLK